ncbi:MAG TPA: LysM peptidoglycan-binding domain-containing protein, partial [Anaerolineales bacterium]|nr:LysM peptidoglycan-binding domain-containing protein [Anaerolineales bacterium]
MSENAARCLVCGTELTAKAAPKSKKVETGMQASRMPEVTLSLPAALGALVIILLIGAAVVYFGLGTIGTTNAEPTAEGTATTTATPTLAPTETQPPTPIPTETPLPPLDYTVKTGDFCGGIAAAFSVSVQSIVVLNNLDASCNNISVGQTLKIPYPTPTPAPPPT